MPKGTPQTDLSLLQKNKNGLVYLTANDWALIADKAVRMPFKAGDAIVQRERRTHGIYIVLSGTATVQIPGYRVPRVIGPGEVCGEISFLDELPATASVMSATAVETFYLDTPLLRSLIELYPHLGSRFYHSLAAILSRRLREMIGPAASTEAAASSATSKTDPSKKNSR
jgi:CRP-like cAMP-binding protein